MRPGELQVWERRVLGWRLSLCAERWVHAPPRWSVTAGWCRPYGLRVHLELGLRSVSASAWPEVRP